MSKFGSLTASVEKPHRVEIIFPATDDVVTDQLGRAMYVDVMSGDSKMAREYDARQRAEQRLKIKQSRTGKIAEQDVLEANMRRTAHLTVGWLLVDPATREVLDVPCNEENAFELYSAEGQMWFFLQVHANCNEAANFFAKPAPSSTTMPAPTSEGN